MSHSNNIFQLILPDDWEDTTVFTFKGPFDSGVQHNIIITVDPKPDNKIDLENYVRHQAVQNEMNFPGFTMIAEREKLISSGITAYEIVYKFCPAEKKIIFQKQLFFITDGKGYIITTSFSKKTMKTISHLVDQIIDSFSPVELELADEDD